MTILGIGDSSENDTFPTTDWTKAKAMGCEFGIVRSTTTGAWVAGKPQLREDAMFTINTAKMKTAGIAIFPYIWFDPRPQLTGLEQAQFFMASIGKIAAPGGLKFVILDVEKNSVAAYNTASLIQLKICLEAIKRAGWNPAIYSYPSGLDEFAGMADISWMFAYPLMIAHWDVTAPRCPYPWWPWSYVIWQYTASMSGIRYGFNAKAPGYSAPYICMAVMI